jgi:hypothetical protein
MAHHQKAYGGDQKLTRGLENHLPAPRDFDDWHYLTQLNQARAVAFGIEHFRSLRPLCMGSIMWQLNDCWPVTSWAAVDGDGRKKPLWYAMRDAYADRLLTLRPRTGADIVPRRPRPGGIRRGFHRGRRPSVDSRQRRPLAVDGRGHRHPPQPGRRRAGPGVPERAGRPRAPRPPCRCRPT